jgi:glycosyltransferase involved in cell wall biosynthesis
MPSPSLPTRRPRILQVVSHLALGGAERVAINVVDALREDFDFTIFAVRGIAPGGLGAALADEIKALDVPLHLGARVPMRFGGVITSGFGLTRVVKRVQPDLIHLHTEIPEAAYAAMVTLAPTLRKIPVVRTIHNTVFWRFWRALGRWCDRRLAQAYIAGVSPGCLDEFMALRRESGAELTPENTEVIFNGVREPAPAEHRPAVTQRPIHLVFGGRLEPEKGSDLISQILAHARPKIGHAILSIYGCGTHETQLRELAKSPPPGWEVRLHAPIPNFAAQLARFDLLMMPSRFEGLGLVAIEAAFARVPAIATNAPGLRDVFPANHPWLARPGDALDFAVKLQHALDHPETWDSVAATARAFAQERFAFPAMTSAYQALYRRALDKAARSP